ncbi:MAG: Holliday junction resolvase RuvX [Gammaproteobacteria bacterium]|nr:Holliday junction resolvase RuvX [Gammaproteobacteria bacterium]
MPEPAAPRTLLGFDYGSKFIGVAVGQQLTGTSSPLQTIKVHDDKPDWPAIGRLIETWRPDALVVGIPLHMDGREQEMTHAARRFAKRLEGRYHLPVYETDELLTSLAADRIISGQQGGRRKPVDKDRIHQVSAQLILDTFLTEIRNKTL